MVNVCDALMGSGKSSAAITYMNEHPEKKFIYVTPYVEEAKRITRACRQVSFYEPLKKSEFHGSKTLHTMALVAEDRNVSTTHQAFKYYPNELLDMIREKHYTLIIDENVDVLEELKEDPADVRMAIDAGYLQESHPGTYRLVKDVYNGTTHRDMFRIAKSRDIILTEDASGCGLYYWQLPPDLITAFDDVFVLTYLFEGQGLCCAMKMYDIPYSYIGVSKSPDGVYRFSDKPEYIPEYASHLHDMVNILDDEKLNFIGDDYYALSSSWYKKGSSDVAQLKNNVYNFFRNIENTKAASRMWSTFYFAESRLKGKGYAKGFVPFNMKASNDYRDKDTLVYCTNIFMHVGQKLFYKNNGIDVDENLYALSIMVQWVWRSAIRDGRKINIYIPSRRMRELLLDWIDTVSKGETFIG